MLAVILLVLLFSLPTITGREYQTLPLRLDAAINEFHHRRQALLNVDQLSTTFTIDELYAILSDNDRTTECEKDTGILVEAALRREMWALKVVDAWGKPLPSGILKGNSFWMGNYDECVQQLYLPNNKSFLQQPFSTQYCLVVPDATATSGIVLGTCLPSSCDRPSIVKIIRSLFKHSNFTEDRLECSSDAQRHRKTLSQGAVITVVVLSLLGLLVLTGTVIDVLLSCRVDSSAHRASNINDDGQVNSEALSLKNTPVQTRLDIFAFLAEFSALRTLRRIFSAKISDNNDSFVFINGIRVIALSSIIFGHSLSFGVNYTSNLLDVVAWSHSLAFQLILSAQFSVDTFFVLSGFLTAILFVREIEKQKKLTFRFVLLYYVHRYIRLTPTFMLVVLVSINLTPYFGSGPAFPFEQGFESLGCQYRGWWTSLLYISNLVKPNDMCLPVSWYLQNDMQFHWLAPLALIPFVMRRKWIAFCVATLFVLVSIGSTIGILLRYPYMTSNIVQANPPDQDPTYSNTIYITPWCRISAYAVGLLTGFVLINTGRSYHLNRYIKLIGSLVATLFVLTCMFTMYDDYVLVSGINKPTRIIYEALSRTCWSAAIGWLLFLCSTNQGGIVNRILSWPIWSPLARLNYSAYLIHLMVIFITLLNQRSPTYYDPLSLINTFVSNLFFSYIAAVVVCVFFETPFFIMEKKLFKR